MAKHTNAQKMAVLSRTTLRIKDIQILYDCGTKKAVEIAISFREWFKAKHGVVPYGKQIPTVEFIEFTKYPEKRVMQYAKLGY